MATHPNAPAAGNPCGFHEFVRKIAEVTASLDEAGRAQYEKDADKALEQATIQLLVKQPFFGLLLCNMDRRASWNMPTLAVDGEHLFFNPVCVMLFSRGEQRGALCHEVLHLAFLHLKRRKGRNPGRWNRAADYCDNLVVKDEVGLPLPEWVCYDQRFKGMVAEQVYKILDAEENPTCDNPGPGDCDEGDEDGEEGAGDGKPGGKKPGKQHGKGKGNNCPDCQAEANGEGGHVMDGHIENSDITEDEIVDKVVRAAEQAKAQGNVPASVDTFIRNLRKAKVDWRKFIRGRALDIFTKKDYRPEMRSFMSGPVARAMGVRSTWMPGIGSEEMKLGVAVIDTSGSVSTGLLKAFASELKGVMELTDRFLIITCDAQVHEVYEVSRFDDILKKLKFRGGGGTDFCPPFAKVEEMKLRPELLIYFTDAWGNFPKKPNYPVIWALTQQHGEVPWGESVVCTDENDARGE